MARMRLVGIAGYVEGEVYEVLTAEEKILGRSRACDISLRKTRKWRQSGKLESEAEREFRSVSRQHVAVRLMADGRVRIRSLGRNGTFLDGVRIDEVVLRDLPKRPYELRLGPVETFRLEWVADPPPAPPGDTPSAATIVQPRE